MMTFLQLVVRHIVGYLIGIALFFILIPWLFWHVAQYDALSAKLCIVHSGWILFIETLLFFVGFVFIFWSNGALLAIGKGGPTDGFGVAVSPRTKHLVVLGPYKYTRNPMIFGAVCVYIGIGIHLASVFVVALVVIGTPLFMVYVKSTEEKRLLRDFGEEYLEYKKRVPMFFPKLRSGY